jgi:hypothetical protein
MSLSTWIEMIIEAKVRLPPMTTTLAYGPVPARHAIVKLVCDWVPPNLSEKHGRIDIFDQPGNEEEQY